MNQINGHLHFNRELKSISIIHLIKNTTHIRTKSSYLIHHNLHKSKIIEVTKINLIEKSHKL